jgi:hypothetical protein
MLITMLELLCFGLVVSNKLNVLTVYSFVDFWVGIVGCAELFGVPFVSSCPA